MILYTKAGDRGFSSMHDGKKLNKASQIFNVVGSIDHLNAILGWVDIALQQQKNHFTKTVSVKTIQSLLFDIGACIAQHHTEQKIHVSILEKCITDLEKDIDYATSETPKLQNFILPGGSELAARFHLARTAARDAERVLWSYFTIPSNAHIYLNRLSDWCFALSRFCLYKNGQTEIIWTCTKP